MLSDLSAVAYFAAHLPQPPFLVADGGEPVVLYCFVFLYVAAAGGGAWSVDAQRGRG